MTDYEGEDFDWVEPNDEDIAKEPEAEVGEKYRTPTWMKVGAVAMVGLWGMMLGSTIEHRRAKSEMRSAHPDGCPTLPPSHVKRIERTTETQPTTFDRLNKKGQSVHGKVLPEAVYMGMVNEQARKNSLTLLDVRPYQKAILHTENVSTAMAELNNFSKNYGFTVWAPGKINLDHKKIYARRYLSDGGIEFDAS